MEKSRTVLVFGAAVAACALMNGAANAQTPATPAASGAATAPAAATPRDADGHPVLAGLWASGAAGVTATAPKDTYTQTYQGRGGSFVGLEADGGLRRTTDDNKPLYKPQYWDEITDNDYQGNWEDPVNSCIPLGVPRMGEPAQILKVQGQPAYIFLYRAGFTGYGGSYEEWDVSRWIWMDGRPHNVNYAAGETQMGDSTAHWDGDTLVIDTIGFTDSTWLHKNGWEHGFNMKVTERVTRSGNNLIWQATVEDPDFLQQPWVMTPQLQQLNPDPNAVLGEDPPCQVREPFSSHVRSG